MDKNLKRSLLFGAAVGGIFTLFRNAGRKQQLADSQLKVLNDLKDIFVKVQNGLSGNLALAPVLDGIKEFESKKQYQNIITNLEQKIQKDAENLGLVKSFKNRLQYVLSGRFTEERNNAKSHQSQTFFTSVKELPDILESLLEKHTQIMRLMQKGFRYIESERIDDFKSNDKILLQEYTSQYQALEKQASTLLAEFKK
jgi:hypothetical protein